MVIDNTGVLSEVNVLMIELLKMFLLHLLLSFSQIDPELAGEVGHFFLPSLRQLELGNDVPAFGFTFHAVTSFFIR